MTNNIDMTGWTDEQKEEYRLNLLCEPLYDMYLEFERTFGNKVLELGISDEDAEKISTMMGGEGAFVGLISRTKVYRVLQRFHVMCCELAAAGEIPPIGATFDEVVERYNKLPKGEA